MNLTEIAFHRRKLILLLVGILMLFGGVSYFTLPAREDPQITIRTAIVTTSFPGMSPARVENLITTKLERAIRSISEVEEITSTSLTGTSIIKVEIYDRYQDLENIWQDLRNKVQEAQGSLPEGTRTSSVNDEYGDVSVVTVALTAPDFTMSPMYDVAKHVRDVLYTVEGTKKIDLLGVQEERIYLEISNARLARLGISPFQLLQSLQTQNIVQPGGMVDTGAKSFVIEPTGNFDDFSQIGETLISLGEDAEAVALSDIVNIRFGFADPPDRTAYYNGDPAIIFAISMLDGYNVLEFSPRIVSALQTIQQTLPVGMNLDLATYQADQVEATVLGVSTNVLQTLAIVLIVVILFLGVRTGLVVGTIVPGVMLVTLALMSVLGMELERMSLATLIISLGLLVDNGIVVAEDFKRRVETGEDRMDALRACGRELSVPLLISSLTTILVFLPLMLADHVAGEYTRSISLVIMIALLTSWVLALCVTPTLCYQFLRATPSTEKQSAGESLEDGGGLIGRLYGPYRGFLKIALRFRITFLLSMILLLVASAMLMGQVPKQFFPDSDRTQVLVYVDLPPDSSERTTDRRIRDILAFLKDGERFAHIASYSGYAGFGGPRFVLSLSPSDPAPNTGFVVVNVDGAEHMQSTIDALRDGFREQFPDMQIRVTRMFLGPSDSSKLEIQVKGPDAGVLYTAGERLKEIFRSTPGTIDIKTDWQNRITKVEVRVDQQLARRAGITSDDIADSIQAYFDGIEVTELRDESDIIPIVMRAEEDERFNLDRMRSLSVYSSERNINVPLFQIATFAPVNQYSRIARENLFRTITVEAKSTLMTAEDLKTIIDPQIRALDDSLPLNHHVEYDGVISVSAEAQAALSANVPIVIGVIILLLVAQFNSYRRALIIVLTIPLVIIGAASGLYLTGSFFGFMETLGLYSLAGIIINNAIVLIDKIDLERAGGKPPLDAVIDACVLRLRPIIMTTITTILGLLPLILSRDPLFYGMSNAMAFGLGVGTVLTLGVVPVLYALMFGLPQPGRETQVQES